MVWKKEKFLFWRGRKGSFYGLPRRIPSPIHREKFMVEFMGFTIHGQIQDRMVKEENGVLVRVKPSLSDI